MILRELEFEISDGRWLLLLAAGIGWAFFILSKYRQGILKRFAKPPVLDAILVKREPALFWLKVLFYILAWIFAVIAFMGPKGNERYLSTAPDGQVASIKKPAREKAILRKKAHEVIFLIDASASMGIADVSGRTRLSVAKEIADEVVRHLQGENASLYAFTSSTIQEVPSTLDYLFFRLILHDIEINPDETEGTDIGQALEYLRKQYFAKESPKIKTLILFSDGGDTRLFDLNEEGRKQAISAIAAPLADAGEKNLRVFVAGLGSAEGQQVPGVVFHGRPVASALEEPLLRRLSLAGRGQLWIAGQQTPFEIAQALNQKIASEESYTDVSADIPPPDRGERTHIYDLYFQIPLAAAILCLMGCLLLPDTYKMRGRKDQ